MKQINNDQQRSRVIQKRSENQHGISFGINLQEAEGMQLKQ